MTDYNEIFGQDVKLDSNFQVVSAANGEVVLTEGSETGVQDIRLRFKTPKGSLFYDPDYGSELFKYYYAENTKGNRLGIVSEIRSCLNADPMVKHNSVKAAVKSWDEKGVVVDFSWVFIGEDSEHNKVLSINSENMDMVIKDANY
ncbi:MAG: GPW/gp25 family protein [Deltaproteobacteria bacterium]|nr:GPW/gp25 family protein [Deltaproteobacteria bacterium]